MRNVMFMCIQLIIGMDKKLLDLVICICDPCNYDEMSSCCGVVCAGRRVLFVM
jgi:hypothetical protein